MTTQTRPDRCLPRCLAGRRARSRRSLRSTRSEEHTSELQSRLHLVCRLLLEKKTSYSLRRRTRTRDKISRMCHYLKPRPRLRVNSNVSDHADFALSLSDSPSTVPLRTYFHCH